MAAIRQPTDQAEVIERPQEMKRVTRDTLWLTRHVNLRAGEGKLIVLFPSTP